MLTKYGVSVTLRSYSAGTGSNEYDPNTGTGTPLGLTGTYDTTRKALITDQPGSQIQRKFGQSLEKDTLIETGEKWLYLDANGIAPDLQDHIIINNIDYSIVDVQVTGPGNIPVLYLLVLKT